MRLRSRCQPQYTDYNIKKFFRFLRMSDQDSFLRIVCGPSNSFSSPPTPVPNWNFFCDHAIPLGDSAPSNYTTCAKVATVQTFIQDSPTDLQPAVLQAVLEYTYIDDRGVRANSTDKISALLNEIGKILGKGGFCISQTHGPKSWVSYVNLYI